MVQGPQDSLHPELEASPTLCLLRIPGARYRMDVSRWLDPVASLGRLLNLALLISLIGALSQFLMAGEGALV
jgi:hypothetical protein